MKKSDNSLIVSHKAIFAIAVPMALGYLTTPLVGIADTAIVGQLGSAALIGGVAVAAIFISVLLTTLNFLRFSTSALTAQAHGRGDQRDLIAVLLRSSLIALIAGLVTILCAHPILALGLWLMHPSAVVGEAASAYFLIRIWSSPFTLLNFVFFAWLLGTGRPFLSFFLQGFLNGLNIVLTYFLVLEANLGIGGAAWGTVFAEAVTVFVSLPFLMKPLMRERGGFWKLMVNINGLRRIMALNSDIMVRSFCLFTAFAFFTRQSAQQSDVVLAANEILMHFFMIAGYFLDGFAVAAEQFIGRAIGAKRRDVFRHAIQMTSLWNLVQAALLSFVFILLGYALIEFMTPNEDVRQTAKLFLWWAALTPLIGVAAFQMDGVFIGATWSKDMRNSMIVSLGLLIVCYFILFPVLGNHGLWLAFCFFLGFRGLTLFLLLSRRERDVFQTT